MTKKISKEQLEQIIQEELANVLTEEQLEEISTAGIKAAMGTVGRQMGAGFKKAKDKVKQMAKPAMDAYKSAEQKEKIEKLTKEMDIIKNRMLLKLQQMQAAAGSDMQGRVLFQEMVADLLEQLSGASKGEPIQAPGAPEGM